jgi:hypothetical protein
MIDSSSAGQESRHSGAGASSKQANVLIEHDRYLKS